MYCVKCKKITDTKKDTVRIEQTKNGRKIKKGTCTICGIMKTQFVKKD